MIFILDYFDFSLSVVCIIIVQLSQLPATSVLYDKEVTAHHVVQVTVMCIFQVLCLTAIHLTITKVGMLVVEQRVIRVGND